MLGDRVVRGSRRYAWAPLIAGMVLGGGVLLIATAVALATGFANDGGSDLFFGALAGATVLVIVGAVQSFYWLLRAGWTSYEVSDGQLRVTRRGKVIKTWAGETLGAIEIGDSWRLLHALPYGSGGLGGLPTLRIEVDEGARLGDRIDFTIYQGWPILLKTESELMAAESVLRAQI